MLRYFFSNEVTTPIDPLIERVLDDMNNTGPDSSEYPEKLAYLERLYALKAKDRRTPISLDTIVIVAGNIAVTVVVVLFESKHVWTSKAKDMIIRPRT